MCIILQYLGISRSSLKSTFSILLIKWHHELKKNILLQKQKGSNKKKKDIKQNVNEMKEHSIECKKKLII